MKFFRHSALILAAFIAAQAGSAFASGSEGFSSAQNNDTRLYNAGKGVFAEKFSCSACPLAGKSLNASLAKEVLGGTPKVQLSEQEQDAVMVYLKRRFKI